MIKNIFILTLLIALPITAFAAGYLEFDDNGVPYKWDTSSPVTYKLDTSNLGPIIKGNDVTPGTADYLVRQALNAWEAVPGSTLTYVTGGNVTGPNSGDIKLSNLSSYVNLNGTSCPVSDFVMVYDDDGTIFADLFGSSSSNILGLATPSVVNKNTHKITCGYALLNGAAIPDASSGSLEQVQYTLMHELGHGRNLEHTQINADLFLDGGNSNDQYIPLMFPVIPQSITSALLGGVGGIKLDDQFSLLYLYNQTMLGGEGRIKGTVKDMTGKGVLGANVICYDKNNPDQNVVSWVSDSNLSATGAYVCGHLPGANYQVKIEPVTIAINQWEQGTPPFIPTEYYNSTNESSDPDIDVLSDKSDVTVPGNDTVENINLITNENGRIISSKKITGSASATNYANLEYFIYVPRSVSKATFTLKGSPSGADVDLYGRCDSPFSLATSTAGPIYDPTSPDTQQAIFAGASNSGNETVTLTGSSTPKIGNCEYHLLVVNYDSSAATFELTATLEGNEPELKADFAPQNSVQSNGERLVSVVTLQAEDDQFSVKSIKFTDTGVKSISTVTGASIYEDTNNSGRVDAADTLLAHASVNTVARTFTLSNLNLFIKEGGQKQLLVTYQMPTSSSPTWPLVFLLMGALVVALFGKNKKYHYTLTILFVGLMLSRCSGSSTSDYNPTVEEKDQIKAKASGFGEQYSIQLGKPSSVKDFFN